MSNYLAFNTLLYFHRESLKAHFCSVEKGLLLPLSRSEQIYSIKISLSATDLLFLYLATSTSPRKLAHWLLFSLLDSSVSTNKHLLSRNPNLPSCMHSKPNKEGNGWRRRGPDELCRYSVLSRR